MRLARLRETEDLQGQSEGRGLPDQHRLPSSEVRMRKNHPARNGAAVRVSPRSSGLARLVGLQHPAAWALPSFWSTSILPTLPRPSQ